MTQWLLLLALLWPTAGAAPRKTERPNPAKYASEIVDRLQARWDEAKTYQADFKQTVFAKRLGTRDESEGVVVVSKPNRLRWTSKTDGTIQILNGNSLTNIHENPLRKITEVDIYTNASKAVDNKLLKFLAGAGRFKELYKFKLDGETAEIATIRFAPKTDDPETLVAEIDKKSYLLRSLTVDSADNRVQTEFSRIRTNVKLDPKLFQYQPKKSDVVRRQ